MQQIELLAPARDVETARAAIDAGADAVYMGASRFGARVKAGNTPEEIGEVARYAHFYGARVYVTLNTILFDDELEAAREMVWAVWRAGADALIVQDMALVEMDLPPIPLHASTQTDNRTPQRVKFLQDVGFERVILARELSLDEIRAIRGKTSVALEAFVHGALCVSYSGQCYMSHACGGRSANRGECAQPCRLPYDLLDANDNVLVQGKHLLSLRDMQRVEYVEQMLDAGIMSFKIEGRLKDVVYVQNVVGAYREALDQVLAKREDYERASVGVSNYVMPPDVSRVFNREFTPYFLAGRDRVSRVDTPKSMGPLIGRVERIQGKRVFMKNAGVLNNGDGLCFFDGALSGIRVNSAAVDYFTVTALNGLTVGMDLHRNLDKVFVEAWTRQPAQRRLGINFMLTQDGGFLKLKGVDETGVEVEKVMEKPAVVAHDMERLHTMVRKQLGKTGGTSFYVQEIIIAAEVDALIAASAMNAMRREVLELLTQQRLQGYVRHEVSITPGDTSWPDTEVLFNGNVANSLARKFYLRHGAGVKEMAPEVSGSVDTGRVVMTTRHCVRYDMGWCKKYPATGCVDVKKTDIKEPLMIRNDQGRVFELRFDCKNCVMEVLMR